MWLLHGFVKKQSTGALNSRIVLTAKSSPMRQKEVISPTYHEVVNCLIGSYATDGAIDETEAGIMRFIQLLNKTLMVFAEVL